MGKKRRMRLVALFGAVLLLLSSECTKQPSKEPEKPKMGESQPGSTSVDTPKPPESSANLKEQEDLARAYLSSQKWTGDLDGMIQRRLIRVLTVYSKTSYFVDRGTQRGLTYESFQIFEQDLNKKLKNKNLRVQVVIVPRSLTKTCRWR